MEALETFTAAMKRKDACEHTAPNGATYKLASQSTHFGAQAIIERRSDAGGYEVIMGWNGQLFADVGAAVLWAVMDGRYEIKPHAPLWERSQLA